MSKELDDYPALKEEIEKKKTKTVPLAFVCESKAKKIEEDFEKEAEMKDKMDSVADPYRFAGYDPNAIDFIRRCETEEEALEIISFLEKKGDLSVEQANNLKQQLTKKGLRSFGEKKEAGFYFHRD